jgi:phosphonate transport system substrate-binding protein
MPLRFVTFLAPNMLPVYRFLAERIGDRLGRPVELVVGTSFDQFEQGEVDLGVICGLPYVWLADRRPPPVELLAAPVLAGDRYGGRPVCYSDVIVSRDSPITCLEELRGCSWAYNEPASHSGHTVALYSLVGLGAQLGFFTRVVEAGFHQRAIRLVHEGVVDAAAIDAQVLGVELRDHPGLADGLRVVGSFGPSTIQPVVAASRLPGWLKDQVRDLLAELGDDPTARSALTHGFIQGFAPVDDAAYDALRRAHPPRLGRRAQRHHRPQGRHRPGLPRRHRHRQRRQALQPGNRHTGDVRHLLKGTEVAGYSNRA